MPIRVLSRTFILEGKADGRRTTFITIYTVLFGLTLPLAESFGGEAYSFGGEASPLPPPVDRTLPMMRGVMSLVVRP